MATPAWNKWSYRFVGAGFVLLIVAMLWGTPKGPFPTAAPTATVTVTSTVEVDVTMVDFTKRGPDDLMKILGTGESLDLEESYDILFGRVLPFETTSRKAVEYGLHAVAPLGKHCVLVFGNNADGTLDLVVGSRYNEGLTAKLNDVALDDTAVAKDIAYWHEGACERGTYVMKELPNWHYLTTTSTI